MIKDTVMIYISLFCHGKRDARIFCEYIVTFEVLNGKLAYPLTIKVS